MREEPNEGFAMKKPVPTFDDITGCLSRKSEHYPDKGAGEPKDLVAEVEGRGCEMNGYEERFLRDTELWTDDVTRRLMVVIEACESVGLPYDIGFEHNDLDGPIQFKPIVITMTGR